MLEKMLLQLFILSLNINVFFAIIIVILIIMIVINEYKKDHISKKAN